RYGLNLSERISTFPEFRKPEKFVSRTSRQLATLLATDANGRKSPIVSHDKNSHDISSNTKQEMIREALQIHAAEITLADRKGFRSFRRPLHTLSPLRQKCVDARH